MRSATNRVAVIGLGVMGRPIAENLARAGLDVVGCTRTPARLGPQPPVPLAASAGDAIRRADVVLLTVPGLDDVWDVLGGDESAGSEVARDEDEERGDEGAGSEGARDEDEE